MSDVAQGPGWWVASDGKWYPPELHPAVTNGRVGGPNGAGSAVAPGRVVAAQGVPVAAVPPAMPVLVGKSDQAWTSHEYRWTDATFTKTRDRREAPTALRRAVDPRGAFVVIVSLVLVVASFWPRYYVLPSQLLVGSEKAQQPVVSDLMGSWRLLIPAACIVTALVGIVNSALRAGQRGAVGFFIALRLMVFVELAMWVIPIFERTVVKTPPGIAATSNGVTIGWFAYSAIAVAAVAVIGSFATMGKSDTT